MSKDPAFLFYPNDWLGGTLGMTFEEKGAYIEILMMQFNRGHMKESMIIQVIGSNWDCIKSKFIQDELGLWYNVRLESEQIKRKAYSESRRNNKKGKNQYSNITYDRSYDQHMIGHMENENEDVNKDIILNKKETKKIEKNIPSISEFSDYAKTIIQDFKSYEFSIENKYNAWIEAGWKDGNGKKIVNWKSKLNNTIPYLRKFEQRKVQEYTPKVNIL
jgi:uncharacterized protein YdaU (DUF1376 family)